VLALLAVGTVALTPQYTGGDVAGSCDAGILVKSVVPDSLWLRRIGKAAVAVQKSVFRAWWLWTTRAMAPWDPAIAIIGEGRRGVADQAGGLASDLCPLSSLWPSVVETGSAEDRAAAVAAAISAAP